MKILLAAGLLAGVIALAPQAHADANTYFENCLHDNGYIVTNERAAINWGLRIQHDEMNGLNRDQILWNLESAGFTPDKANVYVDCAYKTLLN
jgi:hypothetical protein